MQPTPTTIIETRALTKAYGSRRGIADVSLAIPRGSLYGFLGPNGAGKTTTIRILLGFLRPSFGTARVFGMDCWRESAAIKAEVGSIPGDLRLWGWLTGEKALGLFGRIRQRNIRRTGAALAEELELDLRVRVSAMSRGMRQKLGLILALAHEPQLLVLDEPTTGLDPLMQDRLRAILRRMTDRGHTVFFSSHTLAEVEELCDRIAIVRAGKIVADSTLSDLRRQMRHEVEIQWRDGAGAALEPPPVLRVSSRDAQRWLGTVDGDVGALVQWLAGKPLDDLMIAKPDLETIFRRYYEPGELGQGIGTASPRRTTPPLPAERVPDGVGAREAVNNPDGSGNGSVLGVRGGVHGGMAGPSARGDATRGADS